MKKFGIWLLMAVAILAAAATPASLSIDKPTIEIGDSCTLSWTSSSSLAFLSGVGTVPGSGSLRVRPDSTTTFVLLTRAGSHVAYSSVKVAVTGTKGNPSNLPPLEDAWAEAGRDLPALNAPLLVLSNTALRVAEDAVNWLPYGAHATLVIALGSSCSN
jgi:hypothetical protein